MGLPAYVISKKVITEIPNLLSLINIDVTKNEQAEQCEDIIPFTYICKAEFGSPVEISFAIPKDHKLISSEEVVVVLQEKNPSWIKKNKLLNKIEDVLKENGAMNIPPQKNRKT